MFGGKEKKKFLNKTLAIQIQQTNICNGFSFMMNQNDKQRNSKKKLEMNFFLHRIRLWTHKNKRFIHMKKKNLNQNITHTNRERDFRTNWIESFFFW